jgi:hypothetical protein
VRVGTYTLPWRPDRMGEPTAEKIAASVRTYGGVAYFSFGTRIVGKVLPLEWDWMLTDQYEHLRELYAADASLTFYPDATKRLYVASAAGFTVGMVVTGQTSGATGTVARIRAGAAGTELMELSSVTGTFVAGETVEGTGGTPPTETVLAVEAWPDLTVEIMRLEGELEEVLLGDVYHRRRVRMDLLVLAVL